jgi:hypothetical protein
VYLKQLAKWRNSDEAGLRRWLEERRSHYLRHAEALKAPERDLTRIHQKLATIYAAGRLGIRFKLFPWSSVELRDALLTCEQAHIAHVETFSGTSVTPSSLLLDYIQRHQQAFIDLRGGPANRDHDHDRCFGYINEHKGKLEYLFTEEQFSAAVASRSSDVKRELHRRGLLRTTKAGAQRERHVCRRTLIKGTRQWVVAVDACILSEAMTAGGR